MMRCKGGNGPENVHRKVGTFLKIRAVASKPCEKWAEKNPPALFPAAGGLAYYRYTSRSMSCHRLGFTTQFRAFWNAWASSKCSVICMSPIGLLPGVLDGCLPCSNSAADMSPFGFPSRSSRKVLSGGSSCMSGHAPGNKLLSSEMRGYSFRPVASQKTVWACGARSST